MKSNADWPSWTAPMTRICGSAPRRWVKCSRATAESSTSRTLIGRSFIGEPGCRRQLSYQAPDRVQQVALIEAAFDDIRAGTDIDAPLTILPGFQRGDQHDR